MEGLKNKELYMQKFQIAQRNLELVCEENKETNFCKKHRLWHERKRQQSQKFNQ
jgi:hypothetical protein